MFFRFHDLTIELVSTDGRIRAQWAYLLAGWLQAESTTRPDIRLELTWAEDLPERPSTPPIFVDQESRTDAPAILTVYAEADGAALLHFHQAGLLRVPLTAPQPGVTLVATGVITPASLANGRFEDVTFTGLAPMLRRHGYFLLHAFAAVRDGRAALLVGASGSGKTTTGLNLLLNGWELLSNDVALLHLRPDGVYVLAAPDIVSIRPFTLELLPQLSAKLAAPAAGRAQVISAFALTDGRWASPSKATTVYFPQITDQPTRLAPLSRAIGLARLMEQSVDQWDTAVLPDHIAILQALSQQTAVYTLFLGPDVARLNGIITA